MSSGKLVEEYFRLCRTASEEIYGIKKYDRDASRVLVLMQVGSFYEAYENTRGDGYAKQISELLNMHLTKKNTKLEAGDDNPWMCGFPCYALPKHLTRLNDEGYIVVIYDQEKDNPKQRFKKGIYTPNIRMDFGQDDIYASYAHHSETSADASRVLYFIGSQKYRVSVHKNTEYRYLIAYGVLHFETGQVQIQETEDENMRRFLQTFLVNYQPPEILFIPEGPFDETELGEVHKMCSRQSQFYSRPSRDVSDTKSLFYHTMMDAFSLNDTNGQDPIIILNLHRQPFLYECLARTFLFVKELDTTLTKNWRIPDFFNHHDTVLMRKNHDLMRELNLFSIPDRLQTPSVLKQRYNTLYSIFTKKMNKTGKRYFNTIFSHPITDKDILEKRWSMIEQFRGYQKTENNVLDTILEEHLDIDWALLQWCRKTLNVSKLGELFRFYKNIVNEFPKDIPCFDMSIYYRLSEAIDEWEKESIIEEMNRDSKKMWKNPTVLQKELQETEENIQTFLKKVQEQLGDSFKYTQTENHRCCFQTTPKRWKEFSETKTRKNGFLNASEFYVLQKNTSCIRVSHPKLDHMHHVWLEWETRLKNEETRRFHEFSKEWLESYQEVLYDFHKAFAELSCFYHIARVSSDRFYCRPKISDSTCLYIKQLRHPIIEMIEKDSLFVPFDICFEKKDSGKTGMLIYGMNSSGKSTLLKSVGIGVWLAQCGLFVPADEFVFRPFDAVYSKIGTADNLFLGQSTFVSEMNELRYMMDRITDRSLVLCDELTSGTETMSATGLVSSVVLEFLKKQLLFIITTHLHAVAEFPEIVNHPSLSIHHFESNVLPEEKHMTAGHLDVYFDRKLQKGRGKDTYGIEIAQKLGLPDSLIQRAIEFRKRIEINIKPSSDDMRVSKYNSKLRIKECIRCKQSHHLHTHHIVSQKICKQSSEKNSEMLMKLEKKNILANLIVLCEKCHQFIHSSSDE